MQVNPDAFNDDVSLLREWGELFEKALPGGWRIGKDWLLPDGSPPTEEQNGPQDESILLSTYPGLPPVDPHCFGWSKVKEGGWLPGSEAFYRGYVEACRKEYEYITDGNIAMALLQSLLLRTLKIYYEQEKESDKTIEAVEKEIADL